MATLDELQAQLTALAQRVNEITAPPDDYYTHRFSGEEIDNAVDRVNVTPGSGAINAEDVGAAPSGFGLGGTAQNLTTGTDLNGVIKTGWYATGSTSIMYSLLNLPDVFKQGGGLPLICVEAIATTFLAQTFYRIQEFAPFSVDVARRECAAGVWYPWEYENPSMVLGVEYRTTERYKGKPVYAKLVNFGKLPNSTIATVSHNSENFLAAISGDLVNQEGTLLNGYLAITQFIIGRSGIVVVTDRDMSSNVCTVNMKYIKTTD